MTMRVDGLELQRLIVPTATAESDGTAEWNETTVLLVEVTAGGRRGLGWTYGSGATAGVISELAEAVRGADPFATGAIWQELVARCRNLGRPGVCMTGVSAIDLALWDLKARLLDVPLASLLGRVRQNVPIYGSGGFTSYDRRQLEAQLGGWVAEGIPRVKMKVGRDPAADPERVAWARAAIGAAELLVDANGAYTAKQAAQLARCFEGVSWFEEPVSSDDLDGLRWVRDHVSMDVAAGEYGFDPWYFQSMVDAVDVLQADATRCGGVTGFLRVCALADAHQRAISSHCAPNLHAHLMCAAPRIAHAEWFFDHVRIEELLFDGTLTPKDGQLTPDLSRPGTGLTLKKKEAARYAA